MRVYTSFQDSVRKDFLPRGNLIAEVCSVGESPYSPMITDLVMNRCASPGPGTSFQISSFMIPLLNQ